VTVKGWTHAKSREQTALGISMLEAGASYAEVATATGYRHKHVEINLTRLAKPYRGKRASAKRPAIPPELVEAYFAMIGRGYRAAEAARIVLAERPATR
jgi:hypothetical protein